MRTYLKIKADLALLMLTAVMPLAAAGGAYAAYEQGWIAGWFMAWIAFSAGLMSWIPRLDPTADEPREVPAEARLRAREASRIGESR